MKKPQLIEPLLAVKGTAQQVHESALVTYYTHKAFHLEHLEAEIEALDRALVGLRMTLQAMRSRGEDPMEVGLW